MEKIEKSTRPRGRPALGDATIQMVRLPATMLAAMDTALVGKESRAALIRMAIERELARRRG